MDDGLPLGADAGAGAGVVLPRGPLSWPAVTAVLVAVEKRDPHAYRAAVSQLAEGLPALAEAAPAACSIFMYDLLRSVSENLRPGRAPMPEAERLGLIALLGTQADARGLLRTFRSEADRLAAGLSPGRPTHHPVAQRARAFIETHAGERLSLARVARELEVTRTYLSALFRRECGVTLTEYIHHVRIERAEGLLRQGGLSMAAVASLSGYGSYRHFHRSFLKLRQVSPRTYVRSIAAGRRPPAWPIPADLERPAAAARTILD